MTTGTIEKTACILCSRNCGLSVEVQDNQFGKIKGDPEHPLTEGYICQKAARLTHYQQHADRLTQPLKRQADGQFVPVSWDDALADIAQRLLAIRQQHGGDAFAFGMAKVLWREPAWHCESSTMLWARQTQCTWPCKSWHCKHHL